MVENSKRFIITVYDTKSGDDQTVRNVPAENAKEACEKVAKKKGWAFIVDELDNYYGLDAAVYKDYYQLTDEEMEAAAGEIKKGAVDEGAGLYTLFENRDDEDYEDYEDL